MNGLQHLTIPTCLKFCLVLCRAPDKRRTGIKTIFKSTKTILNEKQIETRAANCRKIRPSYPKL